MPPRTPKRLLLPLAFAALIVLFIALNGRAARGYFQDDELDTLTWAPIVSVKEYATAFTSPIFDSWNFRPTGALFFTAMSRTASLRFPPWTYALFAIHILNFSLLWLLLRRFSVGEWRALAGAGFFLLNAVAMDAYWKPMYIFDVLCATFSIATVLFYIERRWILSFAAFWLAYKSKELAVTLPAVLLLWEYWLGEKRYARLAPFFLVGISFGLQGIFLNRNRTLNNNYTFHFTLSAVRQTLPFYAHRFLMFRGSGLLLFLLALLRDSRVWFGLAGMSLTLSTLLFLPGRLFSAYLYLPLAFATVALVAAASKVHPGWAWIALAAWMPFNIHWLNRGANDTLAADAQIQKFVSAIGAWSAAHPEPDPLVYNAPPDPVFHDWGIAAAWNLLHQSSGLRAVWGGSPDAASLLEHQTVVVGQWDGTRLRLERRAPAPP